MTRRSQGHGVSRAREEKAGERGASLVEFALLLPLLLTLVLGIVDFGYLINRSTLINNGAREGAREAIFGSDSATIEGRVRQVTAGLDQTELTVSIDCADAAGTPCPGASYDSEWEPGGSVIVRVEYDYEYITPIVGMLGLGPTHLTSTVEMRIEG